MPKSVKPLSDAEIRRAKPKDKDYQLSDGNGLFLLLKPNGAKYWRFNYVRPLNKKRALIGFGTYPEISLAEARVKREEARKLVAQGIDPQDQKQKILYRPHDHYFCIKDCSIDLRTPWRA